ncbi:MAG: hypothetical protein Q8L48_34760 [Archangium sp.]|nr:hypothetical protein [Archangium sp.]
MTQRLGRRLVCKAIVAGPVLAWGSGCRRPAGKTAISVHAGSADGLFDRLSGVQGSPAPIIEGEPLLTARFREAGIEWSRFPQDCLPNTLTLAGLFPDENADPEAEASYRFAGLDAHVTAALEAGAQILWQSSYDVGSSDGWVGLNHGGRPPAQLDRWSRVLERTLEHLNVGWAGGFQGAVRFVEFLNEPNGLGGFRGAEAPRLVPVFLRFLETIERFNAAHPARAVQPVGPGIPLGIRAWPGLRPLFESIIDGVRNSGRALPVFSFHTYGEDVSPPSNARLARELRALLDGRGLPGAQLWNTEWQATDHVKQVLGIDAARIASATADEQKTYASAMAAYAIACKLRWQGVVTGSFYYRANRRAWPEGSAPAGDGRGGFFPREGGLSPLALQEQLMAQARQGTPERCATTWTDDGELTAQGLRSADGKSAALLVSSLSQADRELEVTFSFEGLSDGAALTPSLVPIRAGAEALVPASLASVVP